MSASCAGRVLHAAAARPDRFADDGHPLSWVGVGEPEQHRRDDPSGVTSGLRHVGELDPGRVAGELPPDQVKVGRWDRHQHRLAGVQGRAYERDGAGQVILVAVVQQRGVVEPVRVAGTGGAGVTHLGCSGRLRLGALAGTRYRYVW